MLRVIILSPIFTSFELTVVKVPWIDALPVTVRLANEALAKVTLDVVANA